MPLMKPLRYRLLLSLAIVLPLGYWVRFSRGVFPEWFCDGFGSVAYEVFWILLTALLLPRISAVKAAIAVFLLTCGIELLQLWQPPWLQALRATLPGRLVLGNTFNPLDFISYAVGSALGGFWLRSLQGFQKLR